MSVAIRLSANERRVLQAIHTFTKKGLHQYDAQGNRCALFRYPHVPSWILKAMVFPLSGSKLENALDGLGDNEYVRRFRSDWWPRVVDSAWKRLGLPDGSMLLLHDLRKRGNVISVSGILEPVATTKSPARARGVSYAFSNSFTLDGGYEAFELTPEGARLLRATVKPAPTKSDKRKRKAPSKALTAREKEAADFHREGLSAVDVAEKMTISKTRVHQLWRAVDKKKMLPPRPLASRRVTIRPDAQVDESGVLKRTARRSARTRGARRDE